MKQHKKYRFWIVGVVILVLFSFLVGTSFACFQKGAESVQRAEDCCKGYCQHARVGDMAMKCCQSHQTKVSQALPAAPAAKALVLAASNVYSALIPPTVLQGPAQSWVCLSPEERPPPSPPLYTLHCVLLI